MGIWRYTNVSSRRIVPNGNEGSPETDDQNMRQSICESSLLGGRTILAVFAHPDDESLSCGGTLARLADAGARIVLLCASRGERGSISDPALVPDGDLASVRTRELHDAAAILGIADVIVLDHRDGNLRWQDVPELHAEIVAMVEKHQPA